MNWVKENKFLTGYIIVMVIGLGVLGFEVLSAGGAYDDVQATYQKQAAEYDRLRKLAPFPSRSNLQQYEVLKKDAANVITAFQVDLSKKKILLDPHLLPLSPERFQDLLKERVTDVRKKAADANVKLPEKFFLGFDKYETTPPTLEAAEPLGRELEAINWIVNQYIESGVQEIESLTRSDLPEERGTTTPRGEGRESRGGPGGRGRPGGGGGGGGNRAGGAGAGGSAARQELVDYYPFDIATICKQQRLQPLLNVITGAKAPQFYVIRQIRIRNQDEKAPPKATPSPDPNIKSTGPTTFILGEQSIEATLRIEIVDFNAPSDSSSVAEKSAPPGK